MKQSYYDIFDHYDAETEGVPQLHETALNTTSVMEQVFASIGTAPKKSRNRHIRMKRIAAIATAAVILVTGGTMLTAAAGYGGLEQFFQSLFAPETPASPTVMEPLVVYPTANFNSTNPDVQFTLLGMYGDQSQAMLSFQITTKDGVTLPTDGGGVLTEYAIVTEEGDTEVLSGSGEICALKKDSSAENTYDLNLFVTQSDLQGKQLTLTFRNFYTQQQVEHVYRSILAYQDRVQKDYIQNTLGEDALVGLDEDTLPEGFDLDAWKAYWNAGGYDQLTREKYSALYASSDKAVAGVWSTSITLDFSVDAPIASAYAYGTIRLQTLSAQISYPEDLAQEDTCVEYMLTLKDGRTIATNSSMSETPAEPETEEIPLSDLYAEWNEAHTVRTEVLCYAQPIAPQDIAEITMLQYQFLWDENADASENGWVCIDQRVIYTNET
jgi:hypothetical protein